MGHKRNYVTNVQDGNLRLDLNRRSMKLTRNGHKTTKATAATFELVKRRRQCERRRSNCIKHQLDDFINCTGRCDTSDGISVSCKRKSHQV